MDGALLAAFERGYLCLPGVMAADMPTWGEFKSLVNQLKKPDVKKTYKSIVVDTVDLAAAACEKYVCNNNGVENLTDLAWGKGTTMFKNEFLGTFNQITQMGYALFFISHAKDKTFTPEQGEAFNQVIPTLKASVNEMVSGMSDIYAYAHPVTDDNGESRVALTIRSADNRVECGSRFKYMPSEIDFNYDSLAKAIGDAIDKEAEVHGKKAVTTKRANLEMPTGPSYDDLIAKFNEIVKKLQETAGADFGPVWAPRIVEITNKYLGKGKKVSDSTRDQVEQLELIVSELEDLM